MPELPEVEVVRATLNQTISGKKIVSMECFWKPIIEGDLELFKKNVLNKRIIEVKRYAKYLIFVLENGSILSHLRMEGKYYYLKELDSSIKYIHVIFHFDDDTILCYSDMRKFGRMVYKNAQDVYHTPPLTKLGVEANQEQVDIEKVYEIIHKKNKPIKTILLDQSVISGLGNIYADEVLFKAGVLPSRLGMEITKTEVRKLLDASRFILNEAILKKGTTIRSYTSSLNVKGEYQNYLCVHTKEICSCCGSSLDKTKIGGRTTYYCSKCQR